MRRVANLLFAIGCIAIPFKSSGASVWRATPQVCEALEFEAQDARMLPQHLTLEGNARLGCANLHLVADRLDVTLSDQQRLISAAAQGHVVLIEGLRLVASEHLFLQGDHFTGIIERATLAVRRSDAEITFDSRGVPLGPNEMEAHGSLKRSSDGTLTLAPADFTLCDCGPDKPPSWRLDATRVVVVPNERAVVMWPRFLIWLPKAGLVPITPPLLPLSFPLKSRAWGLLPPQLAFLGPPHPTIDLPFFIPLGPSFDLTLSPGTRTDWAGAPRLGARFRFFPTSHVEGEAWAQWTYDYSHAMAKHAFAKETFANPSLRQNPTYLAYAKERETLSNRVALGYQHRIQWGASVPQKAGAPSEIAGSWLTHGSWVSDDLVNSDLMVHPSERVAAYLPSRSQVTVRHPLWVAQGGIDHMLRLDNVMTSTGTGRYADLSNVRGAERSTLHRLPYAQFVLPHMPVAGPWSLDVGLSGTRYSTWRGVYDARPGDQPLSLLQLGGGINFANAWGPLRATLRLGGDAVAFDTPGGSTLDMAPVLDAEMALSAAKNFGDFVHMVTPMINYRGLVRPHKLSPLTVAAGEDIIDEHLVRRATQQVRIGLRQIVWQRGAPTGRARLSLDFSIPFDLVHATVLQPLISLRLLGGPWGNGYALLSLDPHRPPSAQIRDLQASYAVAFGPLSLWMNYLHIAPDADRFERSMYELSAPRHELLPDTGLLWGHMLRTGGQLHLGENFTINYSTSAQLPRPNIPPGVGDPACHWGSHGTAKSCITAHSAGVRYISACRCWSLEASASAAPQSLWHTLRVQMVLSIAGINLGATNG